MGGVGRSSESSLQGRSESVIDTTVDSDLGGGLRHVATASEFTSLSHVDNSRARPGSVEARNVIHSNRIRSGRGTGSSLSVETSRDSRTS
jgi:hypothetical protein